MSGDQEHVLDVVQFDRLARELREAQDSLDVADDEWRRVIKAKATAAEARNKVREKLRVLIEDAVGARLFL